MRHARQGWSRGLPFQRDLLTGIVQDHPEMPEEIRDAEQRRKVVVAETVKKALATLPHGFARICRMKQFQHKKCACRSQAASLQCRR